MGADTATYVFAVGESRLVAAEDLAAIPGIGSTAVRAVEEGPLAAVVQSVDAAEFSEKSLRAKLEDLSWLGDVARRHNAVIAALSGARPVAPVRLATVYSDDGNVRALLRERATAFTAALDRVRGRLEWGVKAFALPGDEAPADTPAATGPGAAYLMRRRAERDRASTIRRNSAEAAAELHERLAGMAVATRRYAPQDPRLTGRVQEMVLNSAYLVDESATDAFRAAVESPGGTLQIELTGPWAPYSFTSLEEP